MAEQRCLEAVPGDVGGDSIDAGVVSGEHECERAAVGAASDTDAGITCQVEGHLGDGPEVVEQGGGVGDLELGGIHGDLPGRGSEAACGVGEGDEPGIRQGLRLLRD